MVRCADFYKKWEQEPNWCEKTPGAVSQINSYLDLVKEIASRGLEKDLIYEKFPERAARVVTTLKNEDGRADLLNYIIACLKRDERIMGGDLKKFTMVNNAPPKTEEKLETIDVPSAPIAPLLKEKFAPKENPAPVKESLATQTGKHLIPCPIQPASLLQENCKSLSACYAGDAEVLCCRLNGKTFDEFKICPEIEKVPTPISTKAPCLAGQPCPDPNGQSYVKKEELTRGKVCTLWNLALNQLPGGECPILLRQKKAQEGGFTPAGDIDPTNAAKFVRMGAVKITKAPMEIQFEPSPKQQEFIERMVKTGAFETPEEVVGAALDTAMLQEGGA